MTSLSVAHHLLRACEIIKGYSLFRLLAGWNWFRTVTDIEVVKANYPVIQALRGGIGHPRKRKVLQLQAVDGVGTEGEAMLACPLAGTAGTASNLRRGATLLSANSQK
jgi:hypothetical protein